MERKVTENYPTVPQDEARERNEESDVWPYFLQNENRIVEHCNDDADSAE